MAKTAQPRLRERLKEATHDALLDAAEQVFATSGLHSARIEDIAAQAGVAVGTIYRYFADRDALLTALMVDRREMLLDRLDAAMEASRDAPVPERLLAFAAALVGHWRDHWGLMLHLFEVGRGGKRPLAREMTDRAASIVADGVRQGVIDPGLAELAPALFLGMLRASVVRRVDEGKGPPDDGDLKSVLQVFLHGAARAGK